MSTFYTIVVLTFAVVFVYALAKGFASAVSIRRSRERAYRAQWRLRRLQAKGEELRQKNADAKARLAIQEEEVRKKRLEAVAVLKRKYRICRWLFADEDM